MISVCIVQAYNQLERDMESELSNGSEEFSTNDREYHITDDDDDDDDDLSYIETGRSLAMFNITDPAGQSSLPVDVVNFNDDISDDSDDEADYMALRRLVLYGNK